MSIFTFLYRQSWRPLLLSGASSIIGGIAGAAIIAVVSSEISGAHHPARTLWQFIGLCVLYLITRTYAEVSLLHVTQAEILRLRISLSTRLIATPLKKLHELGAHGMLSILTSDIDVLVGSFALLPVMIGSAALMCCCLAYLGWLSWQLFLVLMVLIGGGVSIYLVFEKIPRTHFALVRDGVDELYKNFQSMIGGRKELQMNALRAKAFVHQVITPSARLLREHYVRGMTTYTWASSIGDITFYLAIGIVLYVIPTWLPESHGSMTSVTLVLLFLVQPAMTLMGALPHLQQAQVSLGRVQQLQRELSQDDCRPRGDDPFAGKSALRLEMQEVTHSYLKDGEDNAFTLGPVDLSISEGEVVFIVGGNGSGKTTLAMLMVGLYEAKTGTLRFNGIEVSPLNREFYKQYFSAVFSDFHVFEELLGSETGNSMKAESYIDSMRLAHKVKVVGGKFSTVELSSGQRKRLALVAAYLEDRPIYLFDEWAADQEPLFKRIFYSELLPELKARGKTVIVITHDDRYFEVADRVLKLEDGQLTEESALYRDSVSEAS